MNILSKLTSNEYNNRLEAILDTKNYSTEVKNLLLSMLYKIENGYEDYKTVKIDAEDKSSYIEKILQIIQNECEEIKVVTPQTVKSKPLEEQNVICITDEKRGSILVYANELDLLYSIFEMDYKYNQQESNYINVLINNIQKFYCIASCMDKSEIIRDFDGWSWNNNIKAQGNIDINFVFQTMQILLGEKEVKNMLYITENIEKNFIDDDEFKRYMYILILIIMGKKDISLKQTLEKLKIEKEQFQDLISDRKQFVNYITDEKKKLNNDIKKLDEILNDNNKLRFEYNARNAKLPNKDKIFSISHLAEKLELEREEKLELIKKNNKILEPIEFIKQKEKNEQDIKSLKLIIAALNDSENEKKVIIDAQIIFLKEFLEKIEKANSNQLLNLMYKFRYYCLLPIYSNMEIKDIPELKSQLEDITNSLIDNGIDKQLIVNFSDSTSVCYSILKFIFVSKIVKLQEIEVMINKLDNKKQTSNLDSKIKVSLYDLKDKEKTYEETVKHLKLIKVKFNKKIKVFL